MAVVQK